MTAGKGKGRRPEPGDGPTYPQEGTPTTSRVPEFDVWDGDDEDDVPEEERRYALTDPAAQKYLTEGLTYTPDQLRKMEASQSKLDAYLMDRETALEVREIDLNQRTENFGRDALERMNERANAIKDRRMDAGATLKALSLLEKDAGLELYREATRAPRKPWDAGTLADQLRKPEPPAGRVEGLIPWEASTAIIAQRKSGKTTLVLNLAHSLITGEPFLGRFMVRPVEGRVALLNFEVSGSQVARWAAEVGIPADRLFIVNLRGVANPFADERDLADLAALLKSNDVETVIVDPFGRAYSGESQNDNGQVQAWLVALDKFARADVGARDVVLCVHTGWNRERSRGASALEDWGDSLIYLTRSEKDETKRYLRADGRDVELDEDLLEYDPDSRRLTLSGKGSRRTARAADRHAEIEMLADSALDVVRASPGLNVGQIAEKLREDHIAFRKGDESAALRLLTEQNLVRVERKGRATLHYPRPVPVASVSLLHPQGDETSADEPGGEGGLS